MERAAEAALAADNATDPVTAARVIMQLLGQMGGALPAMPVRRPAAGPGGSLDRRTVTPLHVPEGTAWFASPDLAEVARQISYHQEQNSGKAVPQ